MKRLQEVNNGISLQAVYDRICASMYPQMVEFEQRNSLGNYYRDLYMEQAMVCGSMGYSEFLSPERLKRILGWQKKSGCYGELDNENNERASPFNQESARDDMEPLGLGRNIRNVNENSRNSLQEGNSDVRSNRRDDRLGGTTR